MDSTCKPSSSNNETLAGGSVLHYADVGLSTELQRILNRSTLDPEASLEGSMLATQIQPFHPSLSHLEPETGKGGSFLYSNDKERTSKEKKMQTQVCAQMIRFQILTAFVSN